MFVGIYVRILTIQISDVNTDEQLVVRLSSPELYENQKLNRIFHFLNLAEIEFETKTLIYRTACLLENGTDLVYIISQLEHLNMPKEILGPVLEILSSKI